MIHTESLTRHFRVGQETVEAVRGVDLDVGAGELVAFLGPDGAGKSTTLRMLTSLLPPTSGRAEVTGLDVARHPAEVRRRIGYIGQKDGAGHNYRLRDEADAMAERVVIIDHGRVIADDTAEMLKHDQAGDRLTVTVRAADVPAARTVLAGVTAPALAPAGSPARDGAEPNPAGTPPDTGHGAAGSVDERIVPDGRALTIGVAAAPHALPRILGRLPEPDRSQPPRGRRLLTTTVLPQGTRVLTDIRNVWWRETLTIVRDPFSLIFSLLQPLVFLGLFGPLLSGLSGEAGVFGGSSLQWFLPGVVVMITMFGTSMTGANLQFEIMTGAFERMLATPLSRSSLMIGRALKELTPLVVQAAIVTLVAVPFGFALYPLHVLAGLVLLGIFGVGSARRPTRSRSRPGRPSGSSGWCSSRCCSRC